MRRVLYTLSVCSLAAACGLVVSASTRRPAPVAAVPGVDVTPPTHDFGNTARESTVSATFELHNRYPVAVTCGPVMKGCSCSSAELDTTVIPPGGRATLTVGWRLAGKRGPSVETVAVPYSGPDGVHGVALAQVTARVLCPVEPDQRLVRLTTAERSAVVRFGSPLGRAFRCTGATPAHPAVKAKVATDGQSVTVSYDPKAASWESAQVSVVVATDQADDREVVIEVRIDP